MVIKRNLTLPKLYKALSLRYEGMEEELALLGQAILRFDEVELTWYLRFSEYTMLTACLIQKNKVTDYQCECDHFINRGHCIHLYKLIDLVWKKKQIKLYPSKIRQRRTSMSTKVTAVVDILPHQVLAEFVKKYACNVEEISLLLITSSLRYEYVEDLPGICESHFEHLLAKYPHKVKSRVKYDQLLRHFNILISDIRNLVRERDFQVASVLYIEVLKSLFPSFYHIANTDQRFKSEVESFEQHVALFDFDEISPLLKEGIKQGIAFTLNQDWYPGAHSDGGFYLLDQAYLPSKQQIKEHLERILEIDAGRFNYPVLAIIARIYGLSLAGLRFHWKMEEWSVCLNIAEKFNNKREINPILFDMINRFVIKDFKEEAYIVYFQHNEKVSLIPDMLKPMVRFCYENRSSRLISNIPKSIREQFLNCLKNELTTFSDYSYYAELATIWDLNSTIQDLINWNNPITFFGLVGGLSDAYLNKHKTEIFSVITYFLTHFFGEQNNSIFREFMNKLKSVSNRTIYDELVNYIHLEFEGRADILSQKDITGLSIEYFKP